jgi:hypothetical protein
VQQEGGQAVVVLLGWCTEFVNRLPKPTARWRRHLHLSFIAKTMHVRQWEHRQDPEILYYTRNRD